MYEHYGVQPWTSVQTESYIISDRVVNYDVWEETFKYYLHEHYQTVTSLIWWLEVAPGFNHLLVDVVVPTQDLPTAIPIIMETLEELGCTSINEPTFLDLDKPLPSELGEH